MTPNGKILVSDALNGPRRHSHQGIASRPEGVGVTPNGKSLMNERAKRSTQT